MKEYKINQEKTIKIPIDKENYTIIGLSEVLRKLADLVLMEFPKVKIENLNIKIYEEAFGHYSVGVTARTEEKVNSNNERNWF